MSTDLKELLGVGRHVVERGEGDEGGGEVGGAARSAAAAHPRGHRGQRAVVPIPQQPQRHHHRVHHRRLVLVRRQALDHITAINSHDLMPFLLTYMPLMLYPQRDTTLRYSSETFYKIT
jgi:hypothetical protein